MGMDCICIPGVLAFARGHLVCIKIVGNDCININVNGNANCSNKKRPFLEQYHAYPSYLEPVLLD